MKRLTIILGVVLLVAAMTAPVFARGSGWGKGHGMKPGWGMEDCAVLKLDLTAEQSAKIQTLREAHLKEMVSPRNRLFSKRAELKALWTQVEPDKDKIMAKQKEISELRDQIRKKKTDYRFEIRKVLTPEQQAKLQFTKNMKRRGPRLGIGRNQRYRSGSMGWR